MCGSHELLSKCLLSFKIISIILCFTQKEKFSLSLQDLEFRGRKGRGSDLLMYSLCS